MLKRSVHEINGEHRFAPYLLSVKPKVAKVDVHLCHLKYVLWRYWLLTTFATFGFMRAGTGAGQIYGPHWILISCNAVTAQLQQSRNNTGKEVSQLVVAMCMIQEDVQHT